MFKIDYLVTSNVQFGTVSINPVTFNVLRIVSNCSNFFKLVTLDIFSHNLFDTRSALEVYPTGKIIVNNTGVDG